MSHQFDLKYFHESSENNDTQKLKDMIKELVNRPDNKDGKTALQKASDKATISYLVNIGANVNVQDANGKTPLYDAASNRWRFKSRFFIPSNQTFPEVFESQQTL